MSGDSAGVWSVRLKRGDSPSAASSLSADLGSLGRSGDGGGGGEASPLCDYNRGWRLLYNQVKNSLEMDNQKQYKG